jgi:5'-nucleotidase
MRPRRQRLYGYNRYNTYGATVIQRRTTARTRVRPYFIGKPNPLIMRSALRQLGAHSEDAVMIGDRMDTDIIAGIESGIETILVLSGVARPDDVARYPYRSSGIAASVAEIIP